MTLFSTHIHSDPKIARDYNLKNILPIEIHMMWLRSMYIARKLILQKWISNFPPTIAQWSDVINLKLRIEELTFKPRKCSKEILKNLVSMARLQVVHVNMLSLLISLLDVSRRIVPWNGKVAHIRR